MMQTKSRPAWLVLAAITSAVGITGCGGADPGTPADMIFVGDNIVTMDPDQPSVEGVAVRGETIVATGTREEVMALQGASTRVVELGDQALVPGFIDAHGHFLAVGQQLDVLSLHPPPVGDVTNIDELVAKIRRWIEERQIPPGETVFGNGYDDSLLEEGRHPTRYGPRPRLDRASDHPEPRVRPPHGRELRCARCGRRHRGDPRPTRRAHPPGGRLQGAQRGAGGGGERARSEQLGRHGSAGGVRRDGAQGHRRAPRVRDHDDPERRRDRARAGRGAARGRRPRAAGGRRGGLHERRGDPGRARQLRARVRERPAGGRCEVHAGRVAAGADRLGDGAVRGGPARSAGRLRRVPERGA